MFLSIISYFVAETSVKAPFFLISYLIAVSLFSMLLFLYGFLPGEYIRNESSAVNDIPTHVEQFRYAFFAVTILNSEYTITK